MSFIFCSTHRAGVFHRGIDAGCAAALGIGVSHRHRSLQAIEKIVARGASVHRVSLPHTKDGECASCVVPSYRSSSTILADTLALPAYYIIALAEASSNLARYTGLQYGTSIYFPEPVSDKQGHRAGSASDFSSLTEFYSGIQCNLAIILIICVSCSHFFHIHASVSILELRRRDSSSHHRGNLCAI